ncbi:MAG: putative Transcriptional regulator, PucR family [Klenkia sp.]|nr:putative Transcriptional regulator, PucR family [Klenkia sp.]
MDVVSDLVPTALTWCPVWWGGAVAMSLAEVLQLDSVRHAGPEVLVGADLLDRPVRWVHTSELAEAAFLLRGGELLLTTGLGISGRGAVGEAAYVAALAERGVAALALELGWTFPEAPQSLVAACRAHGLPLLVLRSVVPFVDITEEVQTALLARSSAVTGRARDVRQALADALLSGSGPAGIVDVLAGLVGAPVQVLTADGALVAAAGSSGVGRRSRPVARRDIVLLERHWGQVVVLPPGRADDPDVMAALTHGAEVLGLALLRSAAGGDLDERRRQLVEDVRAGRGTVSDWVGRSRVLGLVFAAESRCLGLVVTELGAADLAVCARAVAGAFPPGTALVAEVGHQLLAVVAGSAASAAARAVLAAVDAAGARSARVAVGPVVGRLYDVGRSMTQAERAVRCIPDGERFVLAATVTARLLLAEVVDDPLAGELVRQEIGALLAHDAERGTRLVETLQAYLAHGSSKGRAADSLGVRRQTLYARLARIAELIGDVEAPDRHLPLVVAIAVSRSSLAL